MCLTKRAKRSSTWNFRLACNALHSPPSLGRFRVSIVGATPRQVNARATPGNSCGRGGGRTVLGSGGPVRLHPEGHSIFPNISVKYFSSLSKLSNLAVSNILSPHFSVNSTYSLSRRKSSTGLPAQFPLFTIVELLRGPSPSSERNADTPERLARFNKLKCNSQLSILPPSHHSRPSRLLC